MSILNSRYRAHCVPCNTFGEQREIYEWIRLFFKPPWKQKSKICLLHSKTERRIHSKTAIFNRPIQGGLAHQKCYARVQPGHRVAGKSHKKVTSLSSTPERLRQQLEGSVSLSASPLLDASREEFNLNNDAVEEKENPPPSLRPLPSPPLPHKCPPFHPCSRRECKLRKERERVKEALNKTCTNCDDDLYITMCCAEEKELCEDCCNDLGVCSWGFPHANYVL